jgi:hypothetical protein
MHLLGAEQQVIEGQREQGLDFGDAPPLAGGGRLRRSERVLCAGGTVAVIAMNPYFRL